MRAFLGLIVLGAMSLSQADGQAAARGAAQPIAAADSTRVDGAVRSFMATVAGDVTKDGPLAWRKHFADSPAFFMVNDGQMAFAHSGDATKGIQDFAATIRSIRLEWGSDLRVDPLTFNFAVVAASYSEEQISLSGKTVDVRGYFTGVAELRDGRWQIRDAHWSSLRAQ
jgi:hypothetical protein